MKFQVGGFIYLKVNSTKRVRIFENNKKLSPRHIGPFEVIQRIENLAYRLSLLDHMSDIHIIFNVLVLRKWASDSS